MGKVANRRIARNTAVLYMRMLFCMLLSFFTTRLLLKALGVTDFGILNVVGSVASMFVFITTSLSTGCSRFFSYEIGKGGGDGLNKTFSLILIVYAIAAFLLLVLLESVGQWYICNKLVCPSERLFAAMCFFHFVVAQTLISWFAIPYNALIVSYENMGYYAVLSIIDTSMRFVAACCLFLDTPIYDKLMLFGFLGVVTSVVHLLMNVVFVRNKYPEARFKFYFDGEKMREICSFNGWRMFGVFFWTVGNTLLSLLLNSFFGVVVNAAKGVAQQLSAATRSLNDNFLSALKPQIVKLWAQGERVEFEKLVRRASKLSFFLVWLLALPMLVEIEFVLKTWLGTVPEYTTIFTRLIILTALSNAFFYPIETAVQAHGNIAMYELLSAACYALVFVFAYILLRLGHGAAVAFSMLLVFTIVNNVAMLAVAKRLLGIDIRCFCSSVVARMALVAAISFGSVFWIGRYFSEGWIRCIVVGIISLGVNVLAFIVVGLDISERRAIGNLIVDRFCKRKDV